MTQQKDGISEVQPCCLGNHLALFYACRELTFHTELHRGAKYAYRKAFKDNFRVFQYIVNDTEFSYSGKVINTTVTKYLVGCLCAKLCIICEREGVDIHIFHF